MKALRLKLYQNLVNYRREMSYGYVQTYPLPTPSMVKGMAHSLLELAEYNNLKISIQGNFDSVTTNMQKVFKFDRSPDARPENPYIINLGGSLKTAKHGVQFVDLIVNMYLLLHIAFDDELLTERLYDAVKKKTVVLGRNEDIASVDFRETYLFDTIESSDEIRFQYNAYLTSAICQAEQISGTHYRLPFFYEKVDSWDDKRIFKFADAVYVAKGNKIENAPFLKDSEGDLISFLEIAP